MLLSSLMFIPIITIFILISFDSYKLDSFLINKPLSIELISNKKIFYKKIALTSSIINLIISLLIFILFDFSNNQFQFVQEFYDLKIFNVYLGIDGISIYFVLLTTIILPIAIISNWNSIYINVRTFLIIMLLNYL